MPDRTKREIVAAFNRLIARSEMEKITTLRIAEEAEVSKATFYRYFKDKYDVPGSLLPAVYVCAGRVAEFHPGLQYHRRQFL